MTKHLVNQLPVFPWEVDHVTTEVVLLDGIVRKNCGLHMPGSFLPLLAKSSPDIDELKLELATLAFVKREALLKKELLLKCMM